MKEVERGGVDLMITSPPYPMIQMWDKQFSSINPDIKDALIKKNGTRAFDLMHKELYKTWQEVYRVLKKGGFACINIGDATRKVDTNFQLFSNHARIIRDCEKIGFSLLPFIIWRKQTNKPNKFMGSGMLPAGAYVTLEHEFILIFRKGGKRSFDKESKKIRRRSAYFWEERNNWFSDIWIDIKGTTQILNHFKLRNRSGAFPFELSHRLINMYSVQHDTVLDPFLGTGTTMASAMVSKRNSIGFEIDQNFRDMIRKRAKNVIEIGNMIIKNRIEEHRKFVKNREDKKGKLKYKNENYGLPVMTRQETKLKLPELDSITHKGNDIFEVEYSD